MAKEIKFKADLRQEQGSAAARRLRRKGLLPAAARRLSGKSEPIVLGAHEFKMAMREHTGGHALVTLSIEGTDVPALLREVQYDAISGEATHVDFGEISLTNKVRTVIQIKLVGEAAGVTSGGGILEQVMRQIDVECLPTDLIEVLEVDVTSLMLGEALTVADLKLDSRYTVYTSATSPVATVVAPDAEEEVKVETAEDGAEPEVIAKGKAETADADKKGAKK